MAFSEPSEHKERGAGVMPGEEIEQHIDAASGSTLKPPPGLARDSAFERGDLEVLFDVNGEVVRDQ